MKTLREKIPDTAALEAHLDSVLKTDVGDFLLATRDRREQVKGNLMYVLTALLFLLAISVFLFITELRLHDGWMFKGVTMLALLWSTALLIFGRAWFFNTRVLAREINMALVSIFTRTFDRQFLYTNNNDTDHIVASLLAESSLLTSKDITVHADDSYQVYGTGEQEIVFHEIFVTAAEPATTGSRRKTEYEIFRGLLVVAALPRVHNAETYISTEGDIRNFAHNTFWGDLLGTNAVKKTELEWGEFEDALHVASTNPVSAREVLTPEVMQGIYDWWSEHKLNMRLAFKGDKLYLLLPEASIRISTSTTSTKPTVIKRYAMTLARPIWRGLRLVEDVSR